MQKKSFINGLITKVKGEVASNNMNMTSPQRLESSKGQKHNVNNEYPSMNCTFTGTLMKTQFWNQITGEKVSQLNDTQQIMKSYDS